MKTILKKTRLIVLMLGLCAVVPTHNLYAAQNVVNAVANVPAYPFVVAKFASDIAAPPLKMAATMCLQNPMITGAVAAYGLLSNDGRGLDTVAALVGKADPASPIASSLGTRLGMLKDGAVAHLAANKEIAALCFAPILLRYSSEASLWVWDAFFGKAGALALDGMFKEFFIPATHGLYLAHWAYDKAPNACSVYHGMLNAELSSTLRPALFLAYSAGNINGWKFDPATSDITALFNAQIDHELAALKAFKERVEFYITNGPDMLKEARKAACIMTLQRHHSTEEREVKYWDWIIEKSKDPCSAKPNSWWEPTKKSLEGVVTEFSFALPNVFWRLYPYYGQALLLYAHLENRKERLEALRELVNTKLKDWWLEYKAVKATV